MIDEVTLNDNEKMKAEDRSGHLKHSPTNRPTSPNSSSPAPTRTGRFRPRYTCPETGSRKSRARRRCRTGKCGHRSSGSRGDSCETRGGTKTRCCYFGSTNRGSSSSRACPGRNHSAQRQATTNRQRFLKPGLCFNRASIHTTTNRRSQSRTCFRCRRTCLQPKGACEPALDAHF
jgi:hypothetical protein